MPDGGKLLGLEGAYVGSCDAGDCNRRTEAVVLTQTGWLSVCRAHAILEMAQVPHA